MAQVIKAIFDKELGARVQMAQEVPEGDWTLAQEKEIREFCELVEELGGLGFVLVQEDSE